MKKYPLSFIFTFEMITLFGGIVLWRFLDYFDIINDKLNYYGQYGNCYVVQIIDAYADFPAVESECVVAGIVVKYSGPHIIVWEKTDFEY